MAIDLLDHVSTSVVCRELRLAASDLKKRRQALTATSDAQSPAQPAFVEVRAVDLTAAVNRDYSVFGPSEASVRLELTRADGAILALEIPLTHWVHIESLCIAFLAA
jgi:hypothetical protein